MHRSSRSWLLTLLTLLLHLFSAAAVRAAAEAPLIEGHWDGNHADRPRICLDLLPAGRLRLTFDDSRYRHAVVVEGPYQRLRPLGKGTELNLTVDRVVTKELGKCRSSWVRTELATYQLPSLSIAVGRKLSLSVELDCTAQQSTARVCLRQQGRNLLCRALRSTDSKDCRPSPPVTLDKILPEERSHRDFGAAQP